MTRALMTLQTNYGSATVELGRAPMREASFPMCARLEDAIEDCRQSGVALYQNPLGKTFAELVSEVARTHRLTLGSVGKSSYRIDSSRNDGLLVSSQSYQPMHADNAHRPTSPDFALLHFESVARSGGESLVLQFPEQLVDRYEDVRVSYETRESVHEVPLVTRAPAGTARVNYSPFFSVARFRRQNEREKFVELADWVENVAVRHARRMQLGECLVINNRCMLHGRSSFVGDRVVNRLWFD